MHVLLDPGVSYSFGVECEHLRWVKSLQNLRRILTQVDALAGSVPPVFFAHADATTLETFEPFSHIYMFDTAFTRDTLAALAVLYNVSKSAQCLVCYHDSNMIVNDLEFNVVFHGKVQVRMSGSSQRRSALCTNELGGEKREIR